MRILMVVFLLAFAGIASAVDVYKYVDDKGVIHYTDKPPSKDAKPTDLPPLQTYSPTAPAAAAPATLPKTDFTVSIASPTPDQFFREPAAEVPIAANVSPAMVGGFGLRYFVDTTAVTPDPIPEMRWTVGGLEPGEHLLSVALYDANGREIARSAPVTIHMAPPHAHP
jgi:hypothetical protein